MKFAWSTLADKLQPHILENDVAAQHIASVFEKEVQLVSSENALGKIGKNLYAISLLKLYASIAALSMSWLKVSSSPSLIALCFIAALDTIKGIASKVNPDAAIICDHFYKTYNANGVLSLPADELKSGFFDTLKLGGNETDERFYAALNDMTEKGIVRLDESNKVVTFLEFFLFKI